MIQGIKNLAFVSYPDFFFLILSRFRFFFIFIIIWLFAML